MADTPAFTGPGSSDGYAQVQVAYEGRRIRAKAHRVAYKLLTGEEPEVVDHVNGDIRDNSEANLRAATVLTNRRNNRGEAKHPLPKGTYWRDGMFGAKARGPDGKNVQLGWFKRPCDAHEAYCKFTRSFHGEFFNPGPPKPSIFD